MPSNLKFVGLLDCLTACILSSLRRFMLGQGRPQPCKLKSLDDLEALEDESPLKFLPFVDGEFSRMLRPEFESNLMKSFTDPFLPQ